jgi:hypothetical protein
MSKKSKSPKTAPQPKAVYNHALHFLGTEAWMRKQIDADRELMPLLQYPGMVLCAFTSELFLKCLHTSGAAHPQEHAQPTHALQSAQQQAQGVGRASLGRGVPTAQAPNR